EVCGRILPVVHLTRLECGAGRGRISEIAPDDTVDVDALATGRTAGHLVPGNIVGTPFVHDLVARLPFVLDELVGPRTDCLLDLIVLGGGGNPSWQDERDVARWLAERLEHETEWLLQLRSEEHTSELQSRFDLVCRLLLEK